MTPPKVADRERASLIDYVALARPDHWTKHVFILPGIVLAVLLHAPPLSQLPSSILLGFVAAAAVASANYVLNEWLDAEFDRHHPVKAQRPAVSKELSAPIVWGEYVALLALGLVAGSRISPLFTVTLCLFAVSGVVYNVRPLRLKERAYLDVLVEAVNNPLRLTLGWAMVDAATLPPSSLLLCYWMGGAFLMAIKRLAEMRSVKEAAGEEALALYRRSFRSYSETSLLLSGFVYALLAAFFLAVFLVKYRIEFLLAIPLFVALFAYYLHLGLRRGSAAQTPELLFRDRGLLLLLGLLVLALVVLSSVDLPVLERLSDPHYIRLGGT
jgi:4-hydroxybenzoate polyprenyltransferase